MVPFRTMATATIASNRGICFMRTTSTAVSGPVVSTAREAYNPAAEEATRGGKNMTGSTATAAAVRYLCVCVAFGMAIGHPSARQAPPKTPEQFFGFRIGTDGELARYPKILEYLQHLA